MRILMLGWEFPPFVSGGLGTACQGLTRALNAQGHQVLFVLPKPIGDARSDVVELMGPETLRRAVTRVREIAQTEPDAPVDDVLHDLAGIEPSPAQTVGKAGPIPAPTVTPGTTSFAAVPAGFSGPYTGLNVGGQDCIREVLTGLGESEGLEALASLRPDGGGGQGGGGLGQIKGASAK